MVVPDPGRDGEDILLLEEIADFLFLPSLACYLRRLIFGERQLRKLGIARFLVGFERDRSFPLLASLGQQLLGRVRDQSNTLQEEQIVVTSDGHVAGHRGQTLLKPVPIAFQGPNGTLNRGIKLSGAARCEIRF